MTPPDPKTELHRYLQAGRDAMVWKLEGLSEYDVRRPMAPTGTNLLGLVKHLTGVEVGYFGEPIPRSTRCRWTPRLRYPIGLTPTARSRCAGSSYT